MGNFESWYGPIDYSVTVRSKEGAKTFEDCHGFETWKVFSYFICRSMGWDLCLLPFTTIDGEDLTMEMFEISGHQFGLVRNFPDPSVFWEPKSLQFVRDGIIYTVIVRICREKVSPSLRLLMGH